MCSLGVVLNEMTLHTVKVLFAGITFLLMSLFFNCLTSSRLHHKRRSHPTCQLEQGSLSDDGHL